MNEHLWKANTRVGVGELAYVCLKCMERSHRPNLTPCQGKPAPLTAVGGVVPDVPVTDPQDLAKMRLMLDTLVRIATDQDIESRPACAAIAGATLTRMNVKIPNKRDALAAMARNHAAREKLRREGGDDDA